MGDEASFPAQPEDKPGPGTGVAQGAGSTFCPGLPGGPGKAARRLRTAPLHPPALPMPSADRAAWRASQPGSLT